MTAMTDMKTTELILNFFIREDTYNFPHIHTPLHTFKTK